MYHYIPKFVQYTFQKYLYCRLENAPDYPVCSVPRANENEELHVRSTLSGELLF